MKMTKYSLTPSACKTQAMKYCYRIYGNHTASVYKDEKGYYRWVPGDYDKYDGYDILFKVVNSCY